MESKEPIKLFTSPRNKKSVAMATLVARFAEKLISCSLCRGMESKEPIKIFTSPRNKKKCCHGNTCCQVCRRTNQLQSVQGYGKQRTHKNIYKSKKQKKVLPWQHLLPVIVIKLISSNPCRGLEC